MSEMNGGGDGGDWPKASIGNYKGVMLCNRPNEFGQQKRPERTGEVPFNSRVDPKLPLGWNPSAKLLPRQSKKKGKLLLLHCFSLFLNKSNQIFASNDHSHSSLNSMHS